MKASATVVDDPAEADGDAERDVAGELDQRAERLEDHEVRHREQADRAVAAASDHAPVPPQGLDQAAVPAVALARQHPQRGRRLGPADGVGDEHDAVVLAPLAAVAVQAHDELGVLADGRRVVAARVDHGLAAEQAEGAGDDEQRADARPADAAGQERAQVLDDLDVDQRVARRLHLGDVRALERRAVDDAHDAAAGHGLRVHLERAARAARARRRRSACPSRRCRTAGSARSRGRR